MCVSCVPSEECDDGNIDSADGCSFDCLVEPLFTCVPAFMDIVGPSVCTFDGCINGENDRTVADPNIIPLQVTWQWKECDDGNNVADDGCNDFC